MTAPRVVTIYSRVLAIGGPLLLGGVLMADTRWTGQLAEILVLLSAAVLLRGGQVPLTKYSYLTQTALVALAGSLAVGVPATAIAIAGSALGADWLWQKKRFTAALVNLGREVIALVASFGVYAASVRLSNAAPGLHVELIPALFFYALAYFIISRLLFYFALIIRGKLEQDERLLILRYECIGYGATVIATGIVVGTVSYWPPLAWVFVGAALGALGLLFKHTLEEAIAAEELNKIHAMEAVITSNISLEDSFARIERLAHRLVDWGDFRIYRRQEGTIRRVDARGGRRGGPVHRPDPSGRAGGRRRSLRRARGHRKSGAGVAARVGRRHRGGAGVQYRERGGQQESPPDPGRDRPTRGPQGVRRRSLEQGPGAGAGEPAHHRIHRVDPRAGRHDQPAGVERGHRGRAGGQARQGIRRGGRGSAPARGAELERRPRGGRAGAGHPPPGGRGRRADASRAGQRGRRRGALLRGARSVGRDRGGDGRGDVARAADRRRRGRS